MGGFDKFVSKLERASGTGSEFAGTLREGVYARYFSRAGAHVTFEPEGSKGPDLCVVVAGANANIEIKRLLEGEILQPTDLEAWYRDETEDDFDPGGRDRWTDKVRGVITDAASQLVKNEANVVVVSDWSMTGTRGNFRRAVQLLLAEIIENGTYGRISAVQYDANFLGQTNSYLWANPSADVTLPREVVEMLRLAAHDKAEAANEVLRRALVNEE